jgi:hypothetical protein
MNHVQHHTGWGFTDGSSQTNRKHNDCQGMSGQRASAQTPNSRFHIRFFDAHSDGNGTNYTVGDAHHEKAPCHAVDWNGSNGSGFDQGAQELKYYMYTGGHSYYYYWWGNTDNFRQCDGGTAGSDGYFIWVYV